MVLHEDARNLPVGWGVLSFASGLLLGRGGGGGGGETAFRWQLVGGGHGPILAQSHTREIDLVHG